MKQHEPGARVTLRQVQILEDLLETGYYRGFQTSVAGKLDLTPAAINQFFKKCIENGFMTERYGLTEMGLAWAKSYIQTVKDLRALLTACGISREEQTEPLGVMLEKIDHHILKQIVYGTEHRIPMKLGQGVSSASVVGELRGQLPCAVDYCFYRPERNGRPYSMANRGFDGKGIVEEADGHVWVRLKLRDMREQSRLDGRMMTGRLDSMKFRRGEMLEAASLWNGELRIPLEAFSFRVAGGSEITGTLLVTVTCTAGRMHMPESTALMTIWL